MTFFKRLWRRGRAAAPLPWPACLIEQSRHLRKHLLQIPNHDSSALTTALVPFDTDAPPSPPDVAALAKAFENCYASAAELIDEHTLGKILQGNPPTLTSKFRLSTGFLVIIGLGLVSSAFHYTSWSNRGQSLLIQADDFLQFRHLEQAVETTQLMRTLKAATDTVGQTPVALANPNGAVETLRPQPLMLDALESVAKLEYQYISEAFLLDNISRHSTLFNPINGLRYDFRDAHCPPIVIYDDVAAPTPSDETPTPTPTQFDATNAKASSLLGQSFLASLFCPPPLRFASLEASEPELGQIGGDATATAPETPSTPEGDVLVQLLADGTFDNLDPEQASAIITTTMKELREPIRAMQQDLGRNSLNTYQTTVLRIEEMQREIVQKLDKAHFWALPIIYGALGALVYCLWRVLTPNVSSLGFWNPFMRMIFAGLAAMTLSMIVIPSNIVNVDKSVQMPILYLLSFIFGYSIEGFIRLLNRLNAGIENIAKIKTQ